MTQDSSINKLLGTLYAAPLQPELWNGFLAELSTMTGVTKAALIAHNNAQNDHRMLAVFGDGTRESIHPYESCYYQFDEWTLRFPKGGLAAGVVLGEELWPQTSLLKSTFYNEFLKRFDTCQMACLASAGGPGIFEALSIYRGLSEEEFDPQRLANLQSISSYLKTALYTRRKLLALESRIIDLEIALDQMASALILIDGIGKTVFVNKNARTILDRRDGLSLHKGRLASQSIPENSRLHEILAKAILASTGKANANPGAMRVSRANKRPIQLVAAPLRSETFPIPGKAVAIVFLTDPDQKPVPPAEVLRILFGLTQAETRLALSLLDGNSLSEAADLNSVGRETVRSQVKSIFQKTGTKRQSELTRVLASLNTHR